MAADTKPQAQRYAAQRMVEKMDRAVIASVAEDGKVHVGWRLLRDDPKGIAFSVCRRESGADLPAGVIAEPYRRRWDIEKVFDVVKNKLGESRPGGRVCWPRRRRDSLWR